MVTTLPSQLWAKGALGCEHWAVYMGDCLSCLVCVCSYCTCVDRRHVTAWSLSVFLCETFRLARREWRGVVRDPCFIICLVTGYGGWWGVTDTRQDQSPPIAGSRVINNGGGDWGRGVTGPYRVWSGSERCFERINESIYSKCRWWQSSGSGSGVYHRLARGRRELLSKREKREQRENNFLCMSERKEEQKGRL